MFSYGENTWISTRLAFQPFSSMSIQNGAVACLVLTSSDHPHIFGVPNVSIIIVCEQHMFKHIGHGSNILFCTPKYYLSTVIAWIDWKVCRKPFYCIKIPKPNLGTLTNQWCTFKRFKYQTTQYPSQLPSCKFSGVSRNGGTPKMLGLLWKTLLE